MNFISLLGKPLKSGVCLFFCVAIQYLSVFSQNASPQNWFPKEQLITTGVYYYPEHWDPSQWDRDLKNIAKLGFEFTHFAEFSWPMLEPEEGKYQFEWLDQALNLAQKHKLKVILCTSTATPPVWLTRKHPEILCVNENGTVLDHGIRQHASFSNDFYRSYSLGMIEALGKRYGNHPSVMGWQLDNEPMGFNDHSDNAQIRFRQWLKQKYASIDTLNNAWGNKFWGQLYQNFDQIKIPKESVGYGHNPHSLLDHKRFKADETASFLTSQKDALRKYIAQNQFVTTNFISKIGTVDPKRNRDLDFLTYTMYPVEGYSKGIGERGFRRGNASNIDWANDYYRNVNHSTGVMELQPGQVNWGKNANPQPQPGAVRMWLWHAYAGGCDLACTYRFRQPLFGGEQYHYGIVNTDGVTTSPGGMEYQQFMLEIKKLRTQYSSKFSANPSSYMNRKAAVLYHYDQRWEQDFQKQTAQWNYMSHVVDRYHSNLKSLGAPVDVISEEDDFTSYKVLVAPAYQLLDANLIARWKKYIELGGHLVLTSRTGQKDRNAHLWQAPWAYPIRSLIGADVLFYDHLLDDTKGKIDFNGKTFQWNNWADVLNPHVNTETWATYSSEYYQGKAAVVHRNLGKGTVTYIGPDTDEGELERSVLQKIYTKAGISTLDLPTGVLISYQDGFGIALNYRAEAFELPINNSTIFVGQKIIPSCGVTVWKE